MTPGPTLILRCPGCRGLLQYWTLASGNTLGAVAWSDGCVIAPMLPQAPAACVCAHCRAPFLRDEAETVGQLGLDGTDANDYTVPLTLESCPRDRRLQVMRLLRSALGASIQDAKRIVDSAPALLNAAMPLEDARRVHAELTAAGAVVSPAFGRDRSARLWPEEWTAAPAAEDADESAVFAILEKEPHAGESERTLRILAWHKGNDLFRDEATPFVSSAERPRARANLDRLLSLLTESVDDLLARAEIFRELGRYDECVAALSTAALEHLPAAAVLRTLAREKNARVTVLWAQT